MTGNALRTILAESGFIALFNSLPQPVTLFTLDGEVIEFNAAARRQFGIHTATKVQTFGALNIAPERENLLREFRNLARTGGGTMDVTTVLPDGKLGRDRVTLTPLQIDGADAAILASGYSIDDLERARDEKSALEVEFEGMLASISDGFYVFDADWIVRYMNPRAEVLSQKSVDQLVGKKIWDEFPGLYTTEFGIGYRRAMTEQVTVTVRDTYENLGWLEATSYPTQEGGLAVYVRDVTEEENARRLLEESQRRLIAQAALLDVAHDAIVVRNLNHEILYWNAASSRIYGWSEEEALGRSARDLLYSDPAQFDNAARHTLAEGHWSGELKQLTKSGDTIFSESSWTLVRDADGQPESLLSVNTNITERKRQEAILHRTQRLDSLGTFASGIAHDLNNVLTPILTSAQILAMDETDPGRLAMLSAIESSAARGADMVSQVLSFVRGVEGRRIEVDVDLLLRDFENLCRAMLAPSVVVRSIPGPRGKWVLGDPTQLMQVLMNLATNARDAMPDGGELTIAVHTEVVSSSAAAAAGARSGEFVVLDVEDSGAGMTPDVVARVFEPFFTTKPAGTGTGIGLVTSAAIIRGHHGFLQIYSEPGNGSRFRVYLPAASGEVAAEVLTDQAPGTTLPRGAGERVLIVDDETEIRTSTRHALEGHGFTTALVANAEDALAYLQSENTDVAVVLTDVMMPAMSGIEFAKKLASERPGLPVIAMSGLTRHADLPHDSGSGITAFLAKPFDTRDLVRIVHRVIHGYPESREDGHA